MTTRINNYFHALGAAALAISATATTLLIAAGPVHAQPAATVHFADLDVSTRSGRSQLDERIQRAARNVCATSDMRSVAAARNYAQCRRDAVARTAPMVASLQTNGTVLASAQ